MARRAKIVCTPGPATSGPDQIAALVAAGLDMARLNMSHGSQDSLRTRTNAPDRGRDRDLRSRMPIRFVPRVGLEPTLHGV